MIGFWLGAAGLTVMVVAVLVMPLLQRSGRSAVRRSEYDLIVYRDQLVEIDRDADRGLMSLEQAEAARLEIKRRMLAAVDDRDAAATPPKPSRRAPVVAFCLAFIVPAAAFSLYLALGAPDIPAAPWAARPADATNAVADASPPPEIAEATARLEQRLAAMPDDADGWVLLGRAYMATERYGDAVDAFAKALALRKGSAAVAEHYGEALVAAAGGTVTEAAHEAFQSAVAADPRSVKARYYLALEAAQQGDVQSALQGWTDVAALSAPEAPWNAAVRQQIMRAAAELGVDPASVRPTAEVLALGAADAEAAPEAGSSAASGPGAADVAAAAEMSEAERAEMIRAMVGRLAARLEAEPNDRDGWLRLARAYDVLGDVEKSRKARARAEALPAN
ncbi:MAG: c-type cytochrome biogenesis protein CcmI [Rhodospirillales bacterium]|nr:c-type cytochrome biogenesis protein CcmI [Rhodospirillales bacterium]